MLHTTVQSQRRENGGENSDDNVDYLTNNFFLFLLHDMSFIICKLFSITKIRAIETNVAIY